MSGPDHISLPSLSAPLGCPAALPAVSLDAAALQRLMPMHLVLAPDGRILRHGRSLRKLHPDGALESGNFFDLFELRRPRGARSVAELLAVEGGRLSLHLRDHVHGCFKGVVVPLFESDAVLLNLSFGFSLVEAVRCFDLTAADFAGTDLAIEMLYLVEAKSAALQESKKLNHRLQGAMVAAEEQAFTDTLTGLKNRRALDHVLNRLASGRVPFGLLHLDLDYFKQVNDTHGHAAGDEVLQAVAKVLVNETRERDIAARIGGDEFIVIFQKLVDVRILSTIADRIIRRLQVPVPYGESRLRVSGSIGITTSVRNPSDLESIFEAADLALYASKRAGRSRATVAASASGLAK